MLMLVNTVSENVDTSSVGWTNTRTGSKHGDMHVKNCLAKRTKRSGRRAACSCRSKS